MRFRGLDLNLLAAFDILMQERSVSGAARKLNLSQPAMSAALSRLRDYFDDELLAVQGKRMFPTAFAEQLIPQVRYVLGNLETMLVNRSQFDPATARRTFRVIASDYIIAALIAPVVSRMSEMAPGIMLDLAALAASATTEVDDGKADMLISPDFFVGGEHPTELLFEEMHVVVGWSDNPLLKMPLTEEAFLNSGHVGVRIGAHRQQSFADRQLSVMGYSRRIEVETHSFLTIPLLLVGTPRLAVMQQRLAERLSKSYPITVQPLPFEFPLMKELIQFHETRRRDEGLKWLIALFQEEAGKSANL